MAKGINELKIWIISPDLPEERKCLRTNIAQIVNHRLEIQDSPYRIFVQGWEDLPSVIGKAAQEQINEAFVLSSDIVIGFMNGYVGGNAGTVKEFDTVFESWSGRGTPKRILFYFGSQIQTRGISKQKQEAYTKFQNRVRKRGLAKSYIDIHDFERQIVNDLLDIITIWEAKIPNIDALRTRSDLNEDEWRRIFSSAKKRIWLLGHSMHGSVDPAKSGSVIAKKLASGVDVRLAVLNPFSDSTTRQITEIEQNITISDLAKKIKDTLRFAVSLERFARNGISRRAIQIKLIDSIIYNSLVVVDDRFLVTLYSHMLEMGDQGVTLDLSPATLTHKSVKLCGFFEKEYLWHWKFAQTFDERLLADE